MPATSAAPESIGLGPYRVLTLPFPHSASPRDPSGLPHEDRDCPKLSAVVTAIALRSTSKMTAVDQPSSAPSIASARPEQRRHILASCRSQMRSTEDQCPPVLQRRDHKRVTTRAPRKHGQPSGPRQWQPSRRSGAGWAAQQPSWPPPATLGPRPSLRGRESRYCKR